jgi:hypothetical protein
MVTTSANGKLHDGKEQIVKLDVKREESGALAATVVA